jgi:hypothetical protein
MRKKKKKKKTEKTSCFILARSFREKRKATHKVLYVGFWRGMKKNYNLNGTWIGVNR